MPWVTRKLRGSRVWVKCRQDGTPVAGRDGRVPIVYKREGAAYRASLRNLEPDPDEERLDDDQVCVIEPDKGPRSRRVPAAEAGGRQAAIPKDAVVIYTDGACTGNPGPAGIGVVVIDGDERREISEDIGRGTNNIAEITAVIRALEAAPRDRTVVLHSDSSYVLGFLGNARKQWKPKANHALVARVRELAAGFTDLRLVKVPGHAGVPENERADELARQAIERGR